MIARRYASIGQDTAVASNHFTAADHAHTTEAGAHVNAKCVVAGIRNAELPISQHLMNR